MSEEYSSDELWKLYEALPDELKKAIFSEETANSIYQICQRHNINDEKMTEIAKETGYVLMGLLSPNEFENVLKEKINLDSEKAKKINQEITRFIFFPLKTFLEKLYQIEIEQAPKPIISSEVKDEKPSQQDIYREPIE